jgi:hypothetical protein
MYKAPAPKRRTRWNLRLGFICSLKKCGKGNPQMTMSMIVLIHELITKKRRMSIQFSLGLNQSHELFTG